MGLNLLVFALLGYLLGSFPSGVVIGRLARGVDPRQAGSGHTGTLNTLRTAGKLPAALTLLFDFGKGWLVTWLATQYGWSAYTPAVAGAAAVIGHCWPVWLRFKGGMGLATAGGAAVSFTPVLLPLALAIWWVFLRLTRHSARAMAASVALMPLAALLLGYALPSVGLVITLALVVFIRHMADFRRRYKQGWLE